MKSKERSLLNISFIVLFLIILFAPSIEQRFDLIPVQPVVESRAKVPLPPGNPMENLWLGHGYFSEYEKHFNDVFGFRDFFIRVRNQIQYSLFSDSDQVIIGRDGWLADRSSVDVEQHHTDTLTEEQWAQLQGRIVKFNRILRDRGIYLIIVPVPIKNTVYPEYFPDAAARRPAVTGYERFRRLLAGNKIPFVDAYKILSEKKHSANVYYKTDLHWNTLGARAVAAATVDQLAHDLHRNVRWRYPDSSELKPFVDGGDNNVMAILWPLKDVEPVEFQPENVCGEMTDHGTYKELLNQCRERLLPPATMFGNSFMLQMAADGIQDHFARFDRFYDLSEFPKVLTDIRPGTKIMIWQLFELEIGYQLQQDPWWIQVDSTK